MVIPDDKTPLFRARQFSSDAGWRSDDVPDEGSIVDVYSSDRRGPYPIPFPATFRDDCWFNAQTGEELEVYIEGWRPRFAIGAAAWIEAAHDLGHAIPAPSRLYSDELVEMIGGKKS